MTKKRLVWLRNDLRIADNPALYHAAQRGLVLVIYIEAIEQRKKHNDADCKIGLIYDSLVQLKNGLNKKNIPISVFTTSSYQEIPSLICEFAKKNDCSAISFNNEYPLNELERDYAVEEKAKEIGLEVVRYDADLILPPNEIKTKKGESYKVFTPYKNTWIEYHKHQSIAILPEPSKQNLDLNKFEQPLEDFSREYRQDLWPIGELGAQSLLKSYQPKIKAYKEHRDIPSIAGTSRLSPYLAIGAISARQCVKAVYEAYKGSEIEFYKDTWLSELIWREFYRQLLIDNPQLAKYQAFKSSAKEPWIGSVELFNAWRKGETGFPLIDAAMLQLKQTGWMHNRLRMNVAMFLNKLCLVDWRWGEKYFMSALIDGDFASNNGGWQWCSSTGADAAPYFRIMSPIAQSQRFDPEGKFIKKLLPILSSLSSKDIHNPTIAQRERLGYPEPIIDYPAARKIAIELLA